MATVTPFRYPGAKNKLLPILSEYLDQILVNKAHFVDAFVGGGSVLLDIATRYPHINLFANDKDYWVYCFWKVVADKDTSKLDELLSLIDQPATLELFYKLRGESTTDEIECAYRAIFFNRTTFSGIFNSGPIGGKEQKSKYTVDCRYNAKKLKDKILACHKLLVGRTQVDNQDIAQYDLLNQTNYSIYLDPPYFVKGNGLYAETMQSFEHERLANILQARSKWVLSYDDCPEIRKFYEKNQIIDFSARYCINGKKQDWKIKNELLIIP